LYSVFHLSLAPSLQTGVEPKCAQDHLGHADISVTLNTYTHILPDAQAGVAKKIVGAIV
jgi:integrase